MTSQELNPSQDSTVDDQYGMRQLLTKRQSTMNNNPDTKGQHIAMTTISERDRVLEQFSNAPCRASMKLPPIPREEGE